MTNGLHIFSQHIISVQVGSTWGFELISIFGSFLLFLGILGIFIMIRDHDHNVEIWIICIICIIGGIITWHTKPVYEEVNQYKAISIQNFNFDEFNDQYTGLYKKDGIWYFRDKTSKEKGE